MRPGSLPAAFAPDAGTARATAAEHGTPTYLYDEATLRATARSVLAFGGPFGFRARYAMKANPTRGILRLFAELGLDFDASSTWEARRAVAAGVDASRVQLTAQMLGDGLEDLVRAGMSVTACSLEQIEQLGSLFPGAAIGVRINPGEGSGHNNRTSVAGPNASFGIWHESLPDARRVAERHGLRVTHAHHHVGSGGDPAKWTSIAGTTLSLLDEFPDVETVNLGGGFPVARVAGDREADLAAAADGAARLLEAFAERTGRRLRLEIEPGTLLVAQAGVIVARVVDVVDTGDRGHLFVKLDAGLAEILRPAMYGSQHPIRFVPGTADGTLGPERDLLVVGPCCESGDLLTPARGDPEELLPRRLALPRPGDLAVIGGAGAYCASMAARNYNSFPAAAEVLRTAGGGTRLLRRRQTLEDILREES